MKFDFFRPLIRITNSFKPALQTKRMSTRSHSPPTPNDYEEDEQPLTKRMRMTSPPHPSVNPIASTSKLPYEKGLHLAPMVRIGTLPTRLLG